MTNHISIDIDAPPERVCSLINDGKKLRDWIPNLVENEQLEKTENMIGSTFRQVYLENGRRMEMQGVVTAFEANRRLACHIQGDQFDLDVDYQLVDLGGRTRLTQNSQVQMKGLFKVIGPIFSLFMKKASSKQAEGSFASLKSLAESAHEKLTNEY